MESKIIEPLSQMVESYIVGFFFLAYYYRRDAWINQVFLRAGEREWLVRDPLRSARRHVNLKKVIARK